MPTARFERRVLPQVFFAEQGAKAQLLDTLRQIRDGYEQRVDIDARWADYYLGTGGRFPDRLAIISVVVKLQADLNHTILGWARWALTIVDPWPDDLRQAPADQQALNDIRRRAEALGPPARHHGAGDRPYPPDSPW